MEHSRSKGKMTKEGGNGVRKRCRELARLRIKYGVVKKKVNHKCEEKMHSKVKMTSQRVENVVHVQQHHGKHFYKKIFF